MASRMIFCTKSELYRQTCINPEKPASKNLSGCCQNRRCDVWYLPEQIPGSMGTLPTMEHLPSLKVLGNTTPLLRVLANPTFQTVSSYIFRFVSVPQDKRATEFGTRSEWVNNTPERKQSIKRKNSFSLRFASHQWQCARRYRAQATLHPASEIPGPK